MTKIFSSDLVFIQFWRKKKCFRAVKVKWVSCYVNRSLSDPTQGRVGGGGQ